MQSPLQTQNNQPNQFEEDEIDLLELWNAIYKRKWLVLFLAFLVATVMAVVALSKDNKYKSEVLLAPVASESGGVSGLAAKYGGLASMAGIDLPGGGGGNLTQEALSVLESKRFLYSFIKKNNLKQELFYKKWDAENLKWKEPGFNLIKAAKEFVSSNKKETKIKYEGMEVLAKNEPSTFRAYKLFTSAILKVSQDKKTEFITLGVEWVDPILARDWANQLVNEINEQLRHEHIQQLQTTNKYLKEIISKVKLVELREIIFGLIQENVKSMTLAETRKDYIFKIIDPAIVAEEKSGPKRALMVVIGFILGFILGIFIALILNWKESNKLKPIKR